MKERNKKLFAEEFLKLRDEKSNYEPLGVHLY